MKTLLDPAGILSGCGPSRCLWVSAGSRTASLVGVYSCFIYFIINIFAFVRLCCLVASCSVDLRPAKAGKRFGLWASEFFLTLQ